MEQLAIKQRLEQAGTEYDKGLERFMGNVALYHKFLLKFLADHSYEEFLQALDDGNLPVAEKSVHTLKGTAGNLSLMALFHAADDTVQAIRAGKQGEELQPFAQTVRKNYDTACEAIRDALSE